MLDNIKLGQYLNGDSWYYRLDPRLKLALTTFFIIIILFANSPVTFAGPVLFTLIVVFTSGISLKFFYRSIKPIFLLILITFILNLFLIRTGNPYPPFNLLLNWLIIGVYGFVLLLSFFLRIFRVTEPSVFGKVFKISTLLLILITVWMSVFPVSLPLNLMVHLTFYQSAVANGSLIIIRLVLIICFSSLLTFTTKPTDLTLAIEKVLGPLKVVKLPVSELALMISIALRFIPTLLEETQKILKAQTSRGADFTEGNIKDKVIQIISLLIPMFIISLKRAEDLANTMEARCYVPGKPRTSLRELRWHLRDSLFTLSFIVLTAYLVIFRFVIPVHLGWL